MTLKQRYSTGLERLEFAASQVCILYVYVYCVCVMSIVNEYIMSIVNEYIMSIVLLTVNMSYSGVSNATGTPKVTARTNTNK